MYLQYQRNLSGLEAGGISVPTQFYIATSSKFIISHTGKLKKLTIE